jgi:hypothetical protein
MEIKLTEAELQFLAKTYINSDTDLTITEPNRFTVFHPKSEIQGELVGFSTRTVTLGYDLGFWKNLAVNWFVKFEKDGIIWDKKHKQLKIDPFSFLPEKEKNATGDFSIQEIILQPGYLVIKIGIIPDESSQ